MESTEGAARRAVRLVGLVCRLGLAGVLLAAGALKALDPVGFGAEVAQYGLITGAAARLFAYLLVVVEVAVGAALLLNFRPALAFGAATALMVVFMAAIGWALATGQPIEGGGCVGRMVERTPADTLKEDAAFLAAGLVGWIASRGRAGRGAWKGAGVAAATVMTSAFVVASPYLPLDDMATEIKPGAVWADLGVALAEADLTQGRHFVALLSMREPASSEAVEPLNALASSGGVPMLALHGDDDASYNEFFWSRGPAFPIYKVAPSDMKRMHRSLPRFFAVKDGRVVATWSSLPPAGEVKGMLG